MHVHVDPLGRNRGRNSKFYMDKEINQFKSPDKGSEVCSCIAMLDFQ